MRDCYCVTELFSYHCSFPHTVELNHQHREAVCMVEIQCTKCAYYWLPKKKNVSCQYWHVNDICFYEQQEYGEYIFQVTCCFNTMKFESVIGANKRLADFTACKVSRQACDCLEISHGVCLRVKSSNMLRVVSYSDTMPVLEIWIKAYAFTRWNKTKFQKYTFFFFFCLLSVCCLREVTWTSCHCFVETLTFRFRVFSHTFLRLNPQQR